MRSSWFLQGVKWVMSLPPSLPFVHLLSFYLFSFILSKILPCLLSWMKEGNRNSFVRNKFFFREEAFWLVSRKQLVEVTTELGKRAGLVWLMRKGNIWRWRTITGVDRKEMIKIGKRKYQGKVDLTELCSLWEFSR